MRIVGWNSFFGAGSQFASLSAPGESAWTWMSSEPSALKFSLSRSPIAKRLIGFGTHTGTVAAADDWDEPMQVKAVNPSLDGSYERASHDSRLQRFLLDLRPEEIGREIREKLMEPQLERFIGVIYRPDTERWSHYSQCILPRQYDGWVWFDETKAVTPLPGEQRPGDEETYPCGL